jgi:hypothetical protein
MNLNIIFIYIVYIHICIIVYKLTKNTYIFFIGFYKITKLNTISIF